MSSGGEVISQKTFFSDISILNAFANMTIAALVTTFAARKIVLCEAFLINLAVLTLKK